MKEFLHNGETVKYQEIQDESFLGLLNKAGIVPEEIPDENLWYRVFKYTKDGEKLYAGVIVANAPEAYIEKVYITSKVPDDGFHDLMLDVSGQNAGRDPKMIKSRLSVAAEEAYKEAKKWIRKKYPKDYMAWEFMGYPQNIQNEYNDVVKQSLVHFGYSLETLDLINAPDVDLEYMKNILK